MTSLNELLTRHFDSLDPETREYLRRCCVQLLFRRINNRQFTSAVRKATDNCPQQFKDDLLWRGELLKNLKLFVIYCRRNKLAEEEVVRYRTKYGLAVSDARLYHYAKNYPIPQHIPVYSIRAYDRLLVSVAQEVETFIRKFVYRKMRFVINSTNCRSEDLVSELRCHSLQSVSYMFPYVDS